MINYEPCDINTLGWITVLSLITGKTAAGSDYCRLRYFASTSPIASRIPCTDSRTVEELIKSCITPVNGHVAIRFAEDTTGSALEDCESCNQEILDAEQYVRNLFVLLEDGNVAFATAYLGLF